jgi:hypothetical protein
MEGNDDEERAKRLKLMNDNARIIQQQLSIYMATMQATVAALMDESSDEEEDPKPSGQFRHKLRPYRHKFDHAAAMAAVQRDYLGANPSCKEFSSIYCISKTRFERMLCDFGRTNIRFYHPKYGASLEVRLLHPLKWKFCCVGG